VPNGKIARKAAKAKRIEKGAQPPGFDTQSFFTSVWTRTTQREYRAKETIFRQGDPADAVFYIEKGRVQITVVSDQGRGASSQCSDLASSSVKGASPVRTSIWPRPLR
jgi:hypothetical protein